VRQFIARLEAAGCQPRHVGDGVWFALCPECLANGQHSAIEIRVSETGVAIACAEAHEPRRAA
jgi:hypothetical protein